MLAPLPLLARVLFASTLFLRQGIAPSRFLPDSSHRTTRWFRLVPELALYDNSRRTANDLDPVRYRAFPLGESDGLDLPTDSTGTSTFGWCPREEPCPFDAPLATAGSLALLHPQRVVQIAVRADDTYVGVLQELRGTPFVLLPRRVAGGHQSDLRIGSDCAALAAYGRRRMGEAIPYLGPGGLLPYLVEAPPGRMRAGDVLHYGAQVQVVQEDRGRIGYPDGEDLVIESWHPYPRIVRQDSSGWEGRPFRVMRFRSDTGTGPAVPRTLRDPVGLPLGVTSPRR